MQRRQVLAALGTSAALATAGCLSGGPGGDGGNSETTTTTDEPTTDEPTNTTTPEEPEWNPGPEEPFETITAGTREGVAFPDNNRAHDVKVWNQADSARQFTLQVRTPEADRLETSVEFPADGWLRLVLNVPASYTLSITVDGTEAGEVSVGRSTFDCNDSSTNVIVTPEAEVHSRTFSTLMGCPGPSVADQSFSIEQGSCDMTDEARIDFADEVVEVSGRVKTPNPCYGLELASVELLDAEANEDGTDDVLEVVVAATEQQSDMCTQCVGSVPYTATVTMEHEYPSNVRVIHESMGERRTVRSVTY